MKNTGLKEGDDMIRYRENKTGIVYDMRELLFLFDTYKLDMGGLMSYVEWLDRNFEEVYS